MTATLTANPVRAAAVALADRLRAAHPGLASLSLSGWESWDGRPYVAVNMIAVSPDHQHQGVGTAVMRAIVEAADEHGWTLSLSPSPCGRQPLSMAALTRWYRSFGFLPNTGRRRDYATIEAMVRPATPAWFAPGAKGVSH